ncbi:type 2 lanthipeptide synthetase LanM [Paenibacillus sp. YPG26]|uniref:type 2 lanthipeptide synthetase LanM n=1 Tax=Paenibacillus sp. YPG26 TaxID=2878915 RepID=UPI00203B6B7D|nr:type 2 lanthipeptide synthetase LanM [Paenibacillus sp. YPG26]USB33643.1 type 2 lantipeptide synthetase LanM [Paenibacillus sp. YPG26]
MMNSICSFPAIKNNDDLKISLKEYFSHNSKETGLSEEYFRNYYAPFYSCLKRVIEEHFSGFTVVYPVQSTYLQVIMDEVIYKIREVSSNTLLTELNINRLSGVLQGDTKEERYSFFDDEILGNEEGFFEILEEYPEMLSLIVLNFNQIAEQHYHILTSIINDYTDLKNTFFQVDFVITGYKFGFGDSHNNGKSVVIVETNMGNLVYKPKTLYIEQHFNELLEWINSKSSHLHQQLRYPKVICRQGYGWQEYMDNEELDGLESAHDFYYRQGMNIALMYILNANDFHYENLIAHGAYPVLVDIETFFSNIVPQEEEDELSRSYQTSVLSTMMLPMDFGEILDFEISGLSGKEGQVSSLYSSLKLVNNKSDEMQFVQQPFIVDGKSNIPVFEGQRIEAVNYIEEICEGFSYCYNLIRNAKGEFVDAIHMFKDDTIRVVLRATQTYSEFLSMSRYPKYLVSPDKRKELFNLLYEHQTDKFRLDIIHEEIRSLVNDDVPYFYTSIGSTTIRINEIQIPNYFRISPLDSAKDKIIRLNDDDLKLQIKIIRLSLGFELSKTDADNKYVDTAKLLRISRDDKPEIRHQIEYWAEDILNKSTRLPSGRIQWFSHVTDTGQKAKLGYMLYGLYDGITGMTILFGLLSEFIDSEKYEPYYSLLLEDIMENEHKVLEHENNVCGFGNTGSIIYTYLYLGRLRNDTELISRAAGLAIQFSAKVVSIIEKQRAEIDFVSGISSLLVILCRVNKESASAELTESIGKITDYILLELETHKANEDYRTGFAHGYSGIVFALNLAASYTAVPDTKLEELILLENNKYDRVSGKWSDTRKNDNIYSEDYWCQGSPGMYISRMELSRKLPAEMLMLDELRDRSLGSTREFTNYSLCHGYLGNLLIMDHAHHSAGDGFHLPRSGDEYVGGLGVHTESLGLYLGEAGLVYFLITMLGYDVPKILYLEV